MLSTRLSAALVSLLLVAPPAAAAADEAPGMPTAASPDIDPAAVTALWEYLFQRPDPDENHKGVRTDGLVLVKHGEVILERYYEATGYTRDTRHIAWSASKSFLNALIGIAVFQGKLSLDDRMKKWFPETDHDDARPLTVRHVLNMSSCLEWQESYEGAGMTESSVLAMLYGHARKNMAAYVASKKINCVPGTYWEYSSGNTVLLSELVHRIYGESYATMPWTELFDVIGMKSAVWERDAAGTFVGSSYVYATPRDLARFGLLFLHDGVWEGRRILPEGWSKFVAKPVPALLDPKTPMKLDDGVQGAHWWTNTPIPEKNFPPMWASAPLDTYAALGHWAQGIWVMPSLDLVIVRTGDDRDGTFDEDKFLKLALAAAHVPPVQPPPKPTGPIPGPPAHDTLDETAILGVPGLSSAFMAKEMCSCLYVLKRTPEQCESYAYASPQFATYAQDVEEKRVRAALFGMSVNAFGLYMRAAKFVDEKYGCVAD